MEDISAKTKRGRPCLSKSRIFSLHQKAAAKLACGTIKHHQFTSKYLGIKELYNQREGMFASPKYARLFGWRRA